MLIGRVVETDAAYLDSAIGAGSDLLFDDALSLDRDPYLVAADAIGAAPYLYAADAAGLWDDFVDGVSSAVDAVADVATSAVDRVVDVGRVVGDVLQIVAGPVLDTAQTWLDRVRSWGENAAAWVGRTAELIARGVSEYGGIVEDWIRSVPVLAEIYKGIEAARRITTQVFTLVPRLAAVVIRGDNLVDFIGSEYKQFGANVGAVAEFAALISAFVPGIGQLTGPALALCAGLLEGKDLSSALIGAVAASIPGGGLVRAGVEFGARVGVSLAQGQRIDRAALGALKEALPESARAAFVASIELAQGGSLEDALRKAVAEGLPIDDLLKGAGIEPSKLGDFATSLRFREFPDGIRNMATVLADAGGTVLAQVDLKVPRFPSPAECEALVNKLGRPLTDVRAMAEAKVAIAVFGGAEVVTFNVGVCPLTIKSRLDSLVGGLDQPGDLLAIGDRVFNGSPFVKQAREVRAAVYAAVRAAKQASSDVERAAADAYNQAEAAFLQRTLPGGAERVEMGGGVFVIIGRTKGVPRVIDRIRGNARVIQGGSIMRAIQAGRIKFSLAAELRASAALRGPSPAMRRAFVDLSAPYVHPRTRAFRDALDTPTVIPSTIRTARALAALPPARPAALPLIIPLNLPPRPTTQGIEMRSYYYNPMREAQGIDPSNRAVYIVEAGDGPIRIAQKVVGDGRRWRELVAANPSKPTKKSGPDAGNFVSLRVGERLNLPKSWESTVEKGVTGGGAVVQPVVVPPSPVIVPAPVEQADTTPNIAPSPGPNPLRIVPPDPAVTPAPPSVVQVTPTPTPVSNVSEGTGGGMGYGLAVGAVVLGALVFMGGKRKRA